MKTLIHFIRTMSFKRKLIAYSLLMSIIPVLLLGTASAYLAAKSIQDEVDRNNRLILNQFQYQVNTIMTGLNTSSIVLASSVALEKSVEVGPAVTNLNETFDMIETIRRQRSLSTLKYDVSVIYRKFDYIYSNLHYSTKFTDSNFDRILQTFQPKYNASFMMTPNSFLNPDELLLFRPIPLHTYYTDGILVLHVNTQELKKVLDKLNEGNPSKILIVNEEGRIIISPNKEEIGTKLNPSADLYRFWKEPEQFHETMTLDGVEYKLSALKASENNWTYIAMTPLMELTRKSDHIKNMTWGLIAVLAILWALVSFVGSRRMYFPIERMVNKITWEQSKESSDGLKALDSFLEHTVTMNDRLKNQLNEHLPQIKESFYHKLLLGELTDAEVREQTERMGLALNDTIFYICVAGIDQYIDFLEKYRNKDRALIHYALQKMIEEISENTLPCMTFTSHPGQITIIFGADYRDDTAGQTIRRLLDEFRLHVRKFFPFTVSVSLGNGFRDYTNMNSSYQEALKLLGCRLFMGYDVTVCANDIDPSVKESGRAMIQHQKSILYHVMEGNLDEAQNQLAQMIDELPRHAQSPETVLGLFSYFIGEMEYMIQGMGYELSDLFDFNPYKHLYGLSTLNDVREWLTKTVLPAIKQRMDQLNISKQKRLVHLILTYIQEHYESDLSLQQIAEHFQVSPSHLSRIFKEETDTSFSDYLIDYRMNKAKEWLEHSDVSIKEIAERLRYSTVQNFSRIFRQSVGMPPGEYRKRRRTSENP